MKIVFVSIAVESLAVEFLSSYLKQQNHQADLVFDPSTFATEVIRNQTLAKFFDLKHELIQQIIDKKPDVVGFSVFTINYQRALLLSRLLKKKLPNIPIIFGGIHPTSVPEIVIKEKSVDMVCVGEGEGALKDYLDNPARTDIKNFWFKNKGKIIKNPCRPQIADLNTLPFPDKDLFFNVFSGFFDNYYTISSRGCPFACTYCANNVIQSVYRGLGKPIRRRSPENIVNELVISKKRYHLKRLTFVDDVFVQDLGWLKSFAKLYKKKVNLPFAMLTHPKFLSLEITKTLVKAGCYFLLFGVQSASEETRTKILKRYETNDEIRSAANHCNQAGLKFSIDHIFNIPGEGLDQYVQALNFYNELRPSVINTFLLQYFPKAEIIKTAVKYKILSKKDVSDIEQGKTCAAIIVGFGVKDKINPELIYSHIQYFFMIMPLMPQWLATKIINTKFYLSPIRVPKIVVVLSKVYISLLNNRVDTYTGIIKVIIHFSLYSLKVKLNHFLNFSKAHA